MSGIVSGIPKSEHSAYGAPPQRDREHRLPLRGSIYKPVILLGDVVDCTRCCARRVLVHDKHSPPVHTPDGWRTGLAMGTAV